MEFNSNCNHWLLGCFKSSLRQQLQWWQTIKNCVTRIWGDKTWYFGFHSIKMVNLQRWGITVFLYSRLLFNISQPCHAVVTSVPHKSCKLRKKQASTSANLKTVSLQATQKNFTWIKVEGNLKLSVKRTLWSNKGSMSPWDWAQAIQNKRLSLSLL